jgi:hypothetical protein
MKKLFTTIGLALMLAIQFSAYAQDSWDRDFNSPADSDRFVSLPTIWGADRDFVFAFDKPSCMKITCQATHPLPYVQLWLLFQGFGFKTTPYMYLSLSSDSAQDLDIKADFISGDGFSFPTSHLTGGNKFDTLFLEMPFAAILDRIMMFKLIPQKSQKSVLEIDFLKFGLAADPITATVDYVPKYLSNQICTFIVKDVKYLRGNPMDSLYASVSLTTPNAHITYLKVVPDSLGHDVRSDSTVVITFNADGYDTYAFFSVTLQNKSGSATRTWAIAADINKKYNGIISSEDNQNGLNIYPNPVLDVATIELPDEMGCQLMIVDVAGRILINQSVSKGINKITVNTSMLASGCYSVIISNDKNILVKKFIK